MRKTLYLLLPLFIPFVSLREGAPSAGGEMTKGIIFASSNYLPILDCDLFDLDARDDQNRPINSSASAASLTSLFLENIFSLTVIAPPHAMALAYADAELFSRLFFNLFFNPIERAEWLFSEAIAPPTKRFVHNVDNLWITVSVGVFILRFQWTAYCLLRSVLNLNLRC